MGLLTALLGSDYRASYASWENFWYEKEPRWLSPTATGLAVGPDAMLKVSAVVAGVRVIAETLGMLPLKLYDETPDGGREPAVEDPLYELLHDQPNPWQTAQQFKEMLTAWAILWGEGVAEIKPGRRRVVGELWPLHPDGITRVTQASTGRLVYEIRDTRENGFPQGPPRTLTQDEVFRLSGIGVHRFIPLRLLYLAREAAGLWLAMEQHGARFFSQGAAPHLTLESTKSLGQKGAEKLREAVDAAHRGLKGHHGTLVLEDGVTAKSHKSTARDAQLLEEREFQVRDFARWLRLPHHMLSTEEEPTHNSGEMFDQHLVKYTFGPWAVRWRQSVQRDLITKPGQFAEFVFDALLQGTTKERYEAHAIALNLNNGQPFMAVNEVRRINNLRPWGKEFDGPPPKPVPAPAPTPPTTPPPSPPEPDTRATAVVQEAARRATGREIAAIRRQATPKHLADVDGWRAWATRYYARHAAMLSETLAIPLDVARDYCAVHRGELLAFGLEALERWEAEEADTLAALAGRSGHA